MNQRAPSRLAPHAERPSPSAGYPRRRRGDFDPAHIPLRSLVRQRPIPRSSRRRSPEPPARSRQSPQRQGHKVLLTPGIPAYPRPPRKRHNRPVTPEVAGSSLVAPIENILQIGVFCCRFWRNRPAGFPPVTHSSRTRIAEAGRAGKALQIAMFSGWGRGQKPSVIPRGNRRTKPGVTRNSRTWSVGPMAGGRREDPEDRKSGPLHP